jgi:hypothetical protein
MDQIEIINSERSYPRRRPAVLALVPTSGRALAHAVQLTNGSNWRMGMNCVVAQRAGANGASGVAKQGGLATGLGGQHVTTIKFDRTFSTRMGPPPGSLPV